VTRLLRSLTVVAAFAAGGLAVPAMAASAPTTRLVACPAGSCLAVSGRRPSVEAAVLINGHAVGVEGGRRWQVRLPLATVRDWSEPRARTIVVTTYDAAAQARASDEADLPIGLLGHVDLDSVVIAMK